MSQINTEFVIDFTFLGCALAMAGRLLYLKLNFKSYTEKHKYKPGTIEYKNVKKFTSTPAISIAVIAALLFAVRTVFDVRTMLRSADPDTTLVLVLVPTASL